MAHGLGYPVQEETVALAQYGQMVARVVCQREGHLAQKFPYRRRGRQLSSWTCDAGESANGHRVHCAAHLGGEVAAPRDLVNTSWLGYVEVVAQCRWPHEDALVVGHVILQAVGGTGTMARNARRRGGAGPDISALIRTAATMRTCNVKQT